jgi:DNA repair protein RecN (Recombination protein N)
MLTTLRIKNLALVADLTLELGPGYNVITGETGAGKSILIGALTLVLGERAERGLIRSGAETCSVEAVFDVSGLRAPLKGFLEENGLESCEDNQLLLKRIFTASGANRQFVNGTPTSLNILRELGEWLVDIHGPHEHQSLLSPGRQLAILDAFGKLEPDRETFGELLKRRAEAEAEKAGLIVDERTYAQQLDLLRFQVSEITGANLQAGEEEQAEGDYRRASNAARLLQLGQTALGLVSENETALLTQIGIVGRTLQELQRVDAAAGRLLALQQQGVAALKELQGELSRYIDKVEVDPARLQQLEERLNLVQALKRKYGATVAEVLAFGEEACRKLRSLERRDAEVARLNGKIRELEEQLWRAGQTLSGKRRRLVPQLSKAVVKELSELGFKQNRFEISLTSLRGAPSPAPPDSKTRAEAPALPGMFSGNGLSGANASGLDTVEFQFAPNPGEPPKPLRAIASSGELARVMLGLKTVLAAEDSIPVLVFDEVDANVGGDTANTVGKKMCRIAQKRQVLCITHLAQVAAPASAHYVVSKHVNGGRTISEIALVQDEDRVAELARMLGGQTEAARKHAEALLKV